MHYNEILSIFHIKPEFKFRNGREWVAGLEVIIMDTGLLSAGQYSILGAPYTC